jgi:hypothetical protein
MSVKTIENNNLESVVFSKINSIFDLETLFNEPSPMQLYRFEGTNNQMTLTLVDENGEEDRAILHFSHHAEDGAIDQSKSFRLEFNRDLETVIAVESDEFGSLEELNNLF